MVKSRRMLRGASKQEVGEKRKNQKVERLPQCAQRNTATAGAVVEPSNYRNEQLQKGALAQKHNR